MHKMMLGKFGDGYIYVYKADPKHISTVTMFEHMDLRVWHNF